MPLFSLLFSIFTVYMGGDTSVFVLYVHKLSLEICIWTTAQRQSFYVFKCLEAIMKLGDSSFLY